MTAKTPASRPCSTWLAPDYAVKVTWAMKSIAERAFFGETSTYPALAEGDR